MPKFAINPKTSQLHVFLLETLLGHKHGLTSVYYPPPSSEFILAKVYMCTPLCICLVQCVRQLVSHSRLFIKLRKKVGLYLKGKKNYPCLYVSYMFTRLCPCMRVFILLGLWCQLCLATVWLMSECFPAIYPRAWALGTHSHKEQRERGRNVNM